MIKKMSDAFVYCPSCKSKLTKVEERLVDCRDCGFHFYWNASPTAGAVLENDSGEILLVKRKMDPKKGYWDVPGGFIENNESFEQGLVREIKEELGVELSEFVYIGSSGDLYPYKGLMYHTIVALFSGKISGPVKISDDVSAYKFFKKSDFPRDKFCFPGLQKLIENYLEQK